MSLIITEVKPHKEKFKHFPFKSELKLVVREDNILAQEPDIYNILINNDKKMMNFLVYDNDKGSLANHSHELIDLIGLVAVLEKVIRDFNR